MTKPKTKSPRVDLAALQSDYETRKRERGAAERALERAQGAMDTADLAFQDAKDALIAGSKAVLGKASL